MICAAHQMYSVDQINEEAMCRPCGRCGGEKKCVQSFGGETEGKKTLGRPRRRREGNIKTELKARRDRACTGLILPREGTCDADQKFHANKLQ